MWHVEDPYELNCQVEFVPNPSTQTDPFAQDDTPTINCWSLETNDSILDHIMLKYHHMQLMFLLKY